MGNYYKERMEEFERRFIRRALRRHAGNITATAQALGLTHRQLRYRILQLGLRERPHRLKPL